MKKFMAMLLALVMALSLVACGQKADDTKKDDAADTDDSLVVLENVVDWGETEPYRVLVQKGDPKGLLEGINKAIAELTANDGALIKEIEDKVASQDTYMPDAVSSDLAAETTDDTATSDKPVLVMGTSPDYPPYEFFADAAMTEYAGIDVEVAKYIAESMGMTLQIESMNFDNLVTSLSNGDFDVVLAVIPALLLAMMRLSKIKPIKWFAGAYIAVFRSTPMLVQLSIIYFGLFHYISLPRTLLFGFIAINRFIPGVVALALNSSAYVAEIFRAGILAVDKGQTEAARSLGLSSWQSMRLVVLPQAIKNVLPALANEVVTMVKESSICSVLGMAEIMYTAQTVSGNSYITLAPYVLAALVYFCINYPASKAIEAIERRMRRGDKQ